MYSLGMGDKKINGIFSACQFTSTQVCSAMHRELLVHLNIGSQRLVSEIRQKIKICTYKYKLTYTHYIHTCTSMPKYTPRYCNFCVVPILLWRFLHTN